MESTNTQSNGAFYCFDKPTGISSAKFLHQIKKQINTKKIGHTGTLDPFASGLLVVATFQALKYISYLQEEPKVYQATISLGTQTDTLDLTGQVIDKKPVPIINQDKIKQTLEQFIGSFEQEVPDFSAAKYKGKPRYYWARKDIPIPKKTKKVIIAKLELLGFNQNQIQIKVWASKGSYIRQLGLDIAQALGTCGHLVSLRRLTSGFFSLLNPNLISKISDSQLSLVEYPIAKSLVHYPAYLLNPEQKEQLYFGKSLDLKSEGLPEGLLRLFSDNQFLGLGLYKNEVLLPKRLMATNKE